jgi:hypothetical protein
MGEILTVAVLSVLAGSGLMYVGYLSTRHVDENKKTTMPTKTVVNGNASVRNQEVMAGFTSPPQSREKLAELSYAGSGIGNTK